jgi:hypothetical protein
MIGWAQGMLSMADILRNGIIAWHPSDRSKCSVDQTLRRFTERVWLHYDNVTILVRRAEYLAKCLLSVSNHTAQNVESNSKEIPSNTMELGLQDFL